MLGVGITATPALAAADTVDITTSNFVFEGVDTYTGYINEVTSFDSVHGVWGWTGDAFDGFPSEFTLSDGDNSWSFFADTTTPTITEGGLSTIVMTANTGENLSENYDVALTLTLEGNYARWSYAITGGDTSALTVTMIGEIGSDNESQYDISGNTMVSSDGGDGDPIIGWSVDTDGEFGGFDVIDEESAVVSLTATDASTFSLTQVFQDYEPTAGAQAISFVTSLVPTLDSTFGDSYAATRAPLFTLDPITLTKGVAVNTTLAGVLSQELVDDGYLGQEAGQIGAFFENVPAGLTLTFSQDEDLLPVLTLTGTPTESGEFAADATIYRVYSGESDRAFAPSDAIGELPVSATAAITVPVVDVPVVPAAPAAVQPALAATGFDGMMLIGFGGLAAAAGILLVATTRRRRA